MCGICGVLELRGERADAELVRRMNRTIVHRGPDAEGAFTEGPVALASRRLSIIDVEGGDQPVFNEDGSIAIVFNGEIYGYIELRDELERRGHRFRTRSDTETIVHAYEEFGLDCLSHLNGMFAFALWDRRRRELILARDRVGEKPLFYAHQGDRLSFASEIKALLQDGRLSRELDREAVQLYLSALYIPYPRTIFRAVAKLPPGAWLRVRDGRIESGRYWHPERLAPRPVTLDEAVEELGPLLADAVRVQMRSDVPVGAFLSAGMDSTSVVANAVRTTAGARMKTFAVGFEGADWDERPGARAVAERYGTEHYDITVSSAHVPVLLPRLVWLMDEPMGDGATVPLYAVACLAREHVKVVLCGAGGDELFAGYPRYALGRVPAWRRRLQTLPTGVKDAVTAFAGLYSSGLGNRVDVAIRSVDHAYYADTVWFTDRQRQALTGATGRPYADLVSGLYGRWPAADPVNRLLFVDMHTYLSDDLLPMTDRMTMGVSLEARSPFFDYRLVEWAMGLPSHLKLHDGTSKYVLRRAMAPLLPDEILSRRKRGFGPPFAAWLRDGLGAAARQLMAPENVRRRGLLDPAAVASVLDGDVDDHGAAQRIWMLLVLEIWLRVFADGGDVSTAPGRLDDLL